jgi:hypothetical protein
VVGVVLFAGGDDDVFAELDDVVQGVKRQTIAVFPQIVDTTDGEVALFIFPGPYPAVIKQLIA